MISQFFNLIFYQPLFNLLVILYKYIPGHDFGIAIIALTIIIKIALYPLGNWAIKSQKAISEIQPKIKEVQEKYKNDKEKQTKEIMALYQKEKVNPFSSLLPILIQLPILIALYQVFWKGLDPKEMNFLYSFVGSPEQIKPLFLGMINLSSHSITIAVLSGVLQFFQTKMLAPKTKTAKGRGSDFSNIMQKEMQYLFPVFTVLILANLPSALGIYIITTSLFTIIQQYFTLKKNNFK